ncbi:ATP-binding protein [Thalassomonas viridans]|uniref:ATP-binding protein n=1 Tax=Thalassomonas viridans TaxID=137584 RepID=A0AAF0C9Y8_9GAMM|nr:ATP-binding protein [Thalassomonas viridans]WDE08022.1 ATP-binding protein [Thalassomonas viridans]
MLSPGRVNETGKSNLKNFLKLNPGTGIGLALVKQLVQAQGASISLVPKETGVAFTLDLNATY